MYEYIFFLFIGLALLGVGILIGKSFASRNNNDKNVSDKIIETKKTAYSEATPKPPVIDSDNNADKQKHNALFNQFNTYRKKVSLHLRETENAIDNLTKSYNNTLNNILDSTHESTKNELVSELTQSYQNVFTNLADSAKILVKDDEKLIQHFDSRRDKIFLINTQQRIKKSK